MPDIAQYIIIDYENNIPGTAPKFNSDDYSDIGWLNKYGFNK